MQNTRCLSIKLHSKMFPQQIVLWHPLFSFRCCTKENHEKKSPYINVLYIHGCARVYLFPKLDWLINITKLSLQHTDSRLKFQPSAEIHGNRWQQIKLRCFCHLSLQYIYISTLYLNSWTHINWQSVIHVIKPTCTLAHWIKHTLLSSNLCVFTAECWAFCHFVIVMGI